MGIPTARTKAIARNNAHTRAMIRALPDDDDRPLIAGDLKAACARRNEVLRSSTDGEIMSIAESYRRKQAKLGKANANTHRYRLYAKLADIFEAACPAPKRQRKKSLDVLACDCTKHDGRMAMGEGFRPDCKNESRCLTELVMRIPSAPAAHCPQGCARFVAVDLHTQRSKEQGYNLALKLR